MILRHLELKQFGRFSERSFEFRRGLNLVVGPNEAGKSTLVEAIPAILFGSSKAERFRPWGRPAECRAALVLETPGRTVRIERDLLSDHTELLEQDDLYQVRDSFTGKAPCSGRGATRADYLERLVRLFGVADEELFRASLFFGQGALGFGGGEGFAARVRSLLTGAVDTDYQEVLSTLGDEYFALTRINPWGRDRAKDRQLEILRAELAELEQRQADAARHLAAAAELHGRIGELRENLTQERSDHEQGRQYLAWAHQQWRRIGAGEATAVPPVVPSADVAALLKEREGLRRDYRQTGLPDPIPSELPPLLETADGIRQELVTIGSEATRLRQAQLKLPRLPWVALGSISAIAILLALSAAWLFPDWLWAVLATVAGVLGTCWGLLLRKGATTRRRRQELEKEGREVEAEREAAQERLAALDEAFEALGLSPSAVEVARMQKNLERARRIGEQLQAIENELQLRSAPASPGSAAVVAASPAPPANLLPLAELPEAEGRLEALGRQIAEHEAELLRLVEAEAALQGELLAAEQLDAEIARRRSEEAQLLRRRDLLALSIDLLAGAVEEYHQEHFNRFAEELGHSLRLVTGGRYAEVRCHDDFSFSLRGKGNSWQPLERFSRGTIDACQLAVRLALTRRLARDRHLPLILDDPLVNLDRFRMAEALKMLERLSSEHQVILFSHDEQLLKRAARDRWHVIPLEETRGIPPQSSQERSDDSGQLHLL
ncbi:AAA family ATPase [Desulfuromonas carbonis]|uniref:ATP-binding protein n=1 Tax=Desulfuromonas sp. DDH964 TaxID=1823759 RepID=UPI00078DB04A|nr:AAA family ATPase [Desulfuromonas sp. DDH964]AMV72162.1 DNA repair exonuclease SbcCD, C subunit [Desulfuromonas sp. DDH964]